MNRMWIRFALGLGILCAGLEEPCAGQFPAAPGTGQGVAETVEAIDSARVPTRILYITAHPDDESSSVLTYLARGLHADVALLSLTRGEGGQNALGPEQAPQLGLIRTQELLAATRGYGVKLYFTRARDFGFSKTPTESKRIWGDQVMEDMVRVMREFRPNVVINNWGGVDWGHGHHQAAGQLTPEAVKLAADAKAYPELEKEGLRAWNGGANAVLVLNIDRYDSSAPKGYVLPLDEVSPLYGKSWRQIGLDAFVNHRTQGIAGFLNSPFLRRQIGLVSTDRKTVDAAALAQSLGSDTMAKDVCGCSAEMQAADKQLEEAKVSALKLDWPASVKDLIEAQRQIQKAELVSIPMPVPADIYNRLFVLKLTEEKINRALQLAAGLELKADANRANVVAGEPVQVTLNTSCRNGITCELGKASLLATVDIASLKQESATGSVVTWSVVLAQGASNSEVAGPMELPHLGEQFAPETHSLLTAEREVKIDGYTFTPAVAVKYTDASSTTVERVPLRIVPAYTLAMQPQQVIDALDDKRDPIEVLLRIHSYSTQQADVKAGVDVPAGWTSTAPTTVHFSGVGEQYARVTVTPPARLAAGTYDLKGFAERGAERFGTSLEPLPSMRTLLWSGPAQTVVHAFEIHVPTGMCVGYVSAENEPIPDALKRLGIDVQMLDAGALTFGDLRKYNAIVVGVRAYELRPELAEANKRLLQYAENGGTLVVQYNRDTVWDKLQPAPYPATIGSPTPRITDETSPVRMLRADDRLLNWPNKITASDFDGWVQERGLYFWSKYDAKYIPLLAMNDPGEKELDGGLVYTPYGKGTYIYTGLAFFRELPEGVPGAYRLFVNLLSASLNK